MRRKDREVTEFSKIIDIIKNCDCCRLGLVDNNEAYIIPMNFGYDTIDEKITLYFHCAAEGRKIELIPKQSVVSFEMDTKHELVTGKLGCDFSYMYQSIMGTGSITIVSEISEKVYGLQKIMAHYTNKIQWEFDEKLLDRTMVLRLDVNNFSAKKH